MIVEVHHMILIISVQWYEVVELDPCTLSCFNGKQENDQVLKLKIDIELTTIP